MIRQALLLALAASLTQAAELAPLDAASNPHAGSYAIVVEAATREDAGWSKVVAALAERHPGASIVTWSGSVAGARERLAALMPRRVAFVNRPEQATRTFVCEVHRLARRLDSDPYIDTQWGIVTGATAELALGSVSGPDRLVVRSALNTTGINDGALERALTISDGAKGTWREKQADGKVVDHPALDEPAALKWANYFNAVKPDLMVTSSHGFQHGFETPFGSGFLLARNGTLVPLDRPSGKPVAPELPASPNPKVFFPVGNCLVGHCDGPKSMVCTAMGQLGVRQLAGYTVVTWFGRGGWDMLSTWQSLPGRNSFAESFFINQVRMIADLGKLCPSALAFDPVFPNDGNPEPETLIRQLGSGPALRDAKAVDQRSKEGQEKMRQIIGLMWDRDTVAFYGDPAFDARFGAAESSGVTTRLERTGPRTHRLVVRFENAELAAKGAPDLGVLFTQRIAHPKLAAGAPDGTVLADDFILVRAPKPAAGKTELTVDFEGDVIP